MTASTPRTAVEASAVPAERERSAESDVVRGRLRGPLAVWGPGLIVMLADTDAGCLITAAQSGAAWGYAMVLPQLLLIPILYMAQEITVRLGIVTGKGHGLLIRERFGRGWAYVSASTLTLSAVGALLTEFAGIAGVGELFGVSKWVSVPAATVALIALGFSGRYRRAERIGIAVGLAELFFVPAMILAKPNLGDFARGLGSLPLDHPGYVYLLAANVGAVIMPWMLFYQQTAVIDKGLQIGALRRARRDTAVGAVLTQGVMIVVVVTLAATVWITGTRTSLNTVGQIAGALQPFLGNTAARVLVGAAILGGALVAALVVSLAGAWGLADVLGWKHSLNERVNRTNAKFYSVYTGSHIIGAVLVLASVDLISLSIDVEVMNAILLPVVLGLLLALEAKALPERHRMHGPYRWVVTSLCVIVMAFGLYMIPATLGS